MLAGLWLIVQIAFFSALFGRILDLALRVFRSYGNRILDLFNVGYVGFFRSTPIIVVMVLIHLALPCTGVALGAKGSGILALTLHSAAFVSGISRAESGSVENGQIEDARASGLTPEKTVRLVILSRAFRVVIPPLVGRLPASTNYTAMASSISIPKPLKSAMQLQA